MSVPSAAEPARPRWVLHPTLLAAAFVLEIALSNKIEPAGFARALAVSVLIGLGVTGVAWAITRDRWIGGLLATTLLALNITIVPVYLAGAAIAAFAAAAALIVVGVVIFVGVAVAILRRSRRRRGGALDRGPATSILNRFAGVLLVVVVVIHVAPDLPGAAADALRSRQPISVQPRSGLPDIYVLLLDG